MENQTETTTEKMKGELQEQKGKFERKAGEILDSDKLRGQGKLDEEKGKVRKAVENLKEGVKEGFQKTIGKLTHE